MSTPSTFSDKLTDVIASLTTECTDDILVCGDANCPGPDESSVDLELSDGLDSLGLTQLVTTHSSASRRRQRLCDCMWDSFDPRERTICGIATVTGGRGAVA